MGRAQNTCAPSLPALPQRRFATSAKTRSCRKEPVMTGKAMISLTTELQDPKKMPVTRDRLAVIAAVSALALLAAAGCGK
jgi:hypothetical protein